MKHLAISKWLSQLGLPQYCTLFDEDYDGVEVKADFSLIHYVDTAHSSTHIHTNTDTHIKACTVKDTYEDSAA